ncbi:MAG: hypothetical protein OXF33_05870 [Rhodospirillales bacterium]|nr:hypothetical protein [Rhodospirillales bacterium]MCY4003213.1 hypothetical protein [Rhodospirillales bacterium]
MNDIASDRVGPSQNPPRPGEQIRESMDEVGWNVVETAARLGRERGTLWRLLNGKVVVSANMVLEDIGWGTAEYSMRMQASYGLAQARQDRTAEKGLPVRLLAVTENPGSNRTPEQPVAAGPEAGTDNDLGEDRAHLPDRLQCDG